MTGIICSDFQPIVMENNTHFETVEFHYKDIRMTFQF